MTKTILNTTYNVDDGATDNWTFSFTLTSNSQFTVVATDTFDSDNTYTITLAYDQGASPHQTITYSW